MDHEKAKEQDGKEQNQHEMMHQMHQMPHMQHMQHMPHMSQPVPIFYHMHCPMHFKCPHMCKEDHK